MKHVYWVIWLGTIVFLSLLPGNKIPQIKFELFSLDTLVHTFMYGLLSVLFFVGFEKRMNEFSLGLYIRIILVCSSVGLAIEYIQGYFIFQRFFSWTDAIANTFGAILGAASYYWMSRKLFNFGK